MNKMLIAMLTLGFVFILGACSSPADQPTDDSSSDTDMPTDGDDLTDLEGITWQWVSLAETEPASQSVVPTPESYTLIFLSDGELDIQADCNMVSGSYTINGNELTIEQGPATMAFCDEESLDQQFLDLLSNVESYTIEDSELVLELKDDAGRANL